MDLSQLPSRTLAEVIDVEGEPSFSYRLRDLGIFSGIQIKVLAGLPFSGPLIVQAGGATFALRRGDAQCIQVRVHKASS